MQRRKPRREKSLLLGFVVASSHSAVLRCILTNVGLNGCPVLQNVAAPW